MIDDAQKTTYSKLCHLQKIQTAGEFRKNMKSVDVVRKLNLSERGDQPKEFPEIKLYILDGH